MKTKQIVLEKKQKQSIDFCNFLLYTITCCDIDSVEA